tara:strand:+ start:170 stop:1249 length:1080 start_codon:yes stop_codon:yes gene_type:complete
MQISIPRKYFIPLTLIPSLLILLSHPSGLDIFHYYFHFNDFEGILKQPGYRVFGIFLPRYILLPFIINLFSLLGIIPIFFAFLLFYSYLLSRVYYLASKLNLVYSCLISILAVGALLFATAGTYGFLSLLIILLDYQFFPSQKFVLSNKIDLFFVFISVTNLPLIFVLPFFSKYKKFKKKLIIWIISITVFILLIGLFVNWYQTNILYSEYPEGFLNKRTISFLKDQPLDQFLEDFIEDKRVVLIRFGEFFIFAFLAFMTTKLKSIFFKNIGNIKGITSKSASKFIILFLPFILFIFVNIKDSVTPTIFKLGFNYVFYSNTNVNRDLCFENLITPRIINQGQKSSVIYDSALSLRGLCY